MSNSIRHSGLLIGQREVITVSDFRSRPGDILTQCEMGKRFEITRNGEVIATLEGANVRIGTPKKARRK